WVEELDELAMILPVEQDLVARRAGPDLPAWELSRAAWGEGRQVTRLTCGHEASSNLGIIDQLPQIAQLFRQPWVIQMVGQGTHTGAAQGMRIAPARRKTGPMGVSHKEDQDPDGGEPGAPHHGGGEGVRL